MLSDYLRRDLLQQSVAVALMHEAEDILSAHEQPVFSAPRHQPDLIAQGIHLLDRRLFAQPLFLNQLESLTAEVERLRRRDPEGYSSKNASQRLAAVLRLMLNDIPQDPGRKEYRQGSTLGPEHRHWHRAKFFQQYRLFFRFHIRSKVIVLGWVNDTATKRAYGSKTDAYRVFQST